jgi:hypothetical protein
VLPALILGVEDKAYLSKEYDVVVFSLQRLTTATLYATKRRLRGCDFRSNNWSIEENIHEFLIVRLLVLRGALESIPHTLLRYLLLRLLRLLHHTILSSIC